MADSEALLDLVCGPASPLPETHQRYRLVSHLGTGGQAEVYRAVRVSAGVSSAPVTVKVFRQAGDRPLEEQLRSWDKGDAVLMDLNNRGVPGIVRRADGFYGPRPHPPDTLPSGESVPYQVLDYLHGVTLRDYIAHRYGVGNHSGVTRLNAISTLNSLATTLQALHYPNDPHACPVLHMDVKPSNIMVLPGGDIRLIDFTGARYFLREHITSVAYTLEAGGPEAFTGDVGPAYDVHGFGAVAYYLVTGAFPRTDAVPSPGDGTPAPPWAVLRRHPLLDAHPRLREHLLAPVADRPEDRPPTRELLNWVHQLAELVRRTPCPDVGVDWSEPPAATALVAGGRAIGRAEVPHHQPVAGTETGAFARIERLERELVELRAAMDKPAVSKPEPAALEATRVAGMPAVNAGPAGSANVPAVAAARVATADPTARYEPGRAEVAPVAPMEQTMVDPMGRAEPAQSIRGVASVPQPTPEPEPEVSGPLPEWLRARRAAPPPPPGERIAAWRRGWEISAVAALFAFVCWGIWSISNGREGTGERTLIFIFVLVIAIGVFALSRLLGRLVLSGMLGRPRRNARGAHVLTAAYLVAAGLGFLGQTAWVVRFLNWIGNLF